MILWPPRGNRLTRYLQYVQVVNQTYRVADEERRGRVVMLDVPVDDDDETRTEAYPSLAEQLIKHFRIDLENVVFTPIVHTDGASIRQKISKERISRVGSRIGVYWRKNSPDNVSKLATREPFTNQRAELEAILEALKQANEFQLVHIVVVRDSAYAVILLMP